MGSAPPSRRFLATTRSKRMRTGQVIRLAALRLFDIMETLMRDLLEDQHQVAHVVDAVERMHQLLLHHVRFHGQRPKEVFVGNSELRSLNREQRNRIVELRHEYEALFRTALADG